ncbi:MAG: ParA family protein [Sedimentisphaerales bacterium]|nr:ParA family protein [Sedimentisphaerales bacterium]
MRTIAITNQKGGCGKTTTAVNLAAAFAVNGRVTLLIDLDPQGHATMGAGFDPESLEITVRDLFGDPAIPAGDAVLRTQLDKLDLIPSNILLSGTEFHVRSMNEREYVLKKALSELNEFYDICIIDCSPSLSLLTVNALVCSNDVVIPVQTHFYSLEGLKQVLATVEIVQDRFNSQLEILGILLTFVDRRAKMSRQIQCQLREYFGETVLETVIHTNVRLAEAPSARAPILTYAPKCKAALEYELLAKEIEHAQKDGITKTNT